MNVLRQDDERLLADIVAATLEDGRGSFVARCLDPQNQRHCVCYAAGSASSLSINARCSDEFQSVADSSFFRITPSRPMMNVSGYPRMSYSSTIFFSGS